MPDPSVAPPPSQSCSPITLEYAEELLLMAYDGRCSVMDVSAVAKECPSGDNDIALLPTLLPAKLLAPC